MCPELILWDWNGTLLDDVDLCVDALNRLLAGFGYPQRYDHERYRAIFGFPIEEYYVRAGFDFTKHSFAELAEKYMEDYVPASAACPLADGAIDALEAFKAAGLQNAAHAQRLCNLIVVDGIADHDGACRVKAVFL